MTAQDVSGGASNITLRRDPALTYTLWRSADLGELSWAPAGNATSIITATTITLTDPTPSAGRAFYVVLASE